MVTTDTPEKEGWERVGPYSQNIGTEIALIKTEIVNDRTIRTLQEYDIQVYGTEYRKGDETKRIEERRERLFRRQYTQENSLII